MKKPDFIGLGAQKAGTSWIYACLYEHPHICIPRKEIHFFSRRRNWVHGYDWYENLFSSCPADNIKGEFSTTYLYDRETPERIFSRYPGLKLIACLRNPADRAFSNYINDIKSGSMPKNISFREAQKSRPEYIEQGRYAGQLHRYLSRFPRSHMQILIYEDIEKDPLTFIRSLYGFLGVDTHVTPSMIHDRINIARIPRYAAVDNGMNRIAELMRRCGGHRIAWAVKKSGLPDLIRSLNTTGQQESALRLSGEERIDIYNALKDDIDQVEHITGRELTEWR